MERRYCFRISAESDFSLLFDTGKMEGLANINMSKDS